MNDLHITLGQFLQKRYPEGELIPTSTPQSPKSGTVGDVDDVTLAHTDCVHFKFKHKIPPEDIHALLSEYYTSIGWEVTFDGDISDEQKWISGSVRSSTGNEEAVVLALTVTHNEADPNILTIVTNPIIG